MNNAESANIRLSWEIKSILNHYVFTCLLKKKGASINKPKGILNNWEQLS